MNRKLTVLAVNDPAVAVYVDPKYKILKLFEQKYNVDVQFDIVDFDQYYPALMDVFSGKRQADIVMVAGHFWLKDFVTKGYLQKVDYPSDDSYDRNDILPVIKKEMCIEGIPYLYPSFCDGHVILYRKSFIENALKGKIDEVISTEQYLDILEELSTHADFKGIAYRASASEIFLDALPFLRNRGIEVFESNENFHYDVDLMVKALQDYMSLKRYAKGDMSLFGNHEVAQALSLNQVSLGVSWGGQLGVILNDQCIDKEDIGFSTFKTAWNVTWSFGVSQYADRELSEQLLHYLTSKEVDQIVGGYAGSPVRKSTYITDFDMYPWYPMHLQLVENYAKPLPSVKEAGSLLQIFYHRIYQAYIEELTVEEAAIHIEKDVLNALKGTTS